MRQAIRVKVAFAAFLTVLVASSVTAAQDKKPTEKPPERKDLDESIYQSLRGIIDHGADLYNQDDWNGCYRLWEGTLMSLKPILGHRPKLQEAIDDGLSKARQESVVWQRAWALRPVLNKIRADINADYPHKRKREEGEPPLAKDVPKKTEEKKEEKKPLEKKEEKKPLEKKDVKPPVNAQVTGKVVFKGKPAEGATINLVGADGKTVASAPIAADGSYQLNVMPGEYKVTVSGPAKLGLPAKYADVKTSNLQMSVKEGKQNGDFNLQ